MALQFLHLAPQCKRLQDQIQAAILKMPALLPFHQLLLDRHLLIVYRLRHHQRRRRRHRRRLNRRRLFRQHCLGRLATQRRQMQQHLLHFCRRHRRYRPDGQPCPQCLLHLPLRRHHHQRQTQNRKNLRCRQTLGLVPHWMHPPRHYQP